MRTRARSQKRTPAGSCRRSSRSSLAERTGGNPYFVGEAIRDLRERGALERENGRLMLVGEASIPAAIQGALQARLDRLDAEARELITTAAVIGRSFGLPLLERLLPRARLLPTLSELQWLQLVVEERRRRRARVPLPPRARAGGRLRNASSRPAGASSTCAVGEALEELHRDSPAEVYGLLAHHFAEADEPERAVEYLLKAGDAARAVYADEEAIDLYRRALGFMERTGDEARARQTLLKIALTHHLAFDYHAANEAFSEAFARPAPEPPRLEPSERITWASDGGLAIDEVAPGSRQQRCSRTQVTVNLFRGLVAVGRDFEIEPDLAERFTVSDDGRSYRFTLRADARWSDGTPVTADDFAFTYARMAEDERGPRASWLDGVTASAARRAHARDPTCDEPRNHFLYLLGRPRLFAWPRHVYEQRGTRLAPCDPARRKRPVRPHQPSHAEDARRAMTIESAPAWYGARGNVGEVTIELEAVAARQPATVARRRLRPHLRIRSRSCGHRRRRGDDRAAGAGDSRGYLGLDARRPPLDDARIRRALAHAIDRHALPQALGRNPGR